MLGVLLINKPSGISSHDAVNQVRRRLHTKRVGHAGTLDPLATGLLVVAVGPATRFLQYLPLEPKEYVAEIRFGQSTTTYDAEGEPTSGGPIPADLGSALAEAIPSFLGLVEQLPPMYSAVKVQGKPLYKYARAGQTLEREARRIHIAALDVEACDQEVARVRIVCSGGTYIRTLAHDLGEKLGCGAYLQSLVRTQVGNFLLPDAVPLSDVSSELLTPLSDALFPMPMHQLTEHETADIREGRQIAAPEDEVIPRYGLLEPGGTIISVAKRVGRMLQPECVIPAEVGLDGKRI